MWLGFLGTSFTATGSRRTAAYMLQGLLIPLGLLCFGFANSSLGLNDYEYEW